ncbi:MAG: sigma-54 dependent transcriptional regulator [Bacteroidales bacterium]|nr:sigma-54 dependent transcriptional regulator [Bacteroidales bacterium]MCF8337219.1 sigma-54 dependent transcriptional regulator [Bacteroidales bacterium]
MDLQAIKRRFGVIGNSPELNRAIDTAAQVAPTDISVLITGESGVGKEVFPQIIHHLSSRKHGPYIAVNCGAIPEGTIDSELFGHEKGSFTGAHEARKGYFEVVNGGTIFLDEISELPLATQVRLLRVLESGEFIKVGSSKVLKTDVRIVAASNIDMNQAIEEGKFRQDLFYRLSTVPIFIPPLRDRKDDIYLLFRKFSADFAEKYRMPPLRLTEDAKKLLLDYRWPGNVRQLKNITEQISIIEKDRHITSEVLRKYLPKDSFSELPVLYKGQEKESMTDRDLLYKVLFDMKKDINDLKKVVVEIMRERGGVPPNLDQHDSQLIKKYFNDVEQGDYNQTESANNDISITEPDEPDHPPIEHSEVLEESLSLQKKEVDLIKKALEKHDGKRKAAARELGISERTLYRKIKEYDIK